MVRSDPAGWVHNILIPFPFDAFARTFKLAVVFTLVPMEKMFVVGVGGWVVTLTGADCAEVFPAASKAATA